MTSGITPRKTPKMSLYDEVLAYEDNVPGITTLTASFPCRECGCINSIDVIGMMEELQNILNEKENPGHGPKM